MGIAFVDSGTFRALIVVGLSLFGPCARMHADDAPAFIPSDVIADDAVEVDGVQNGSATSTQFTFDRPAGVVDASFAPGSSEGTLAETIESGIIQVADQKVVGSLKSGNEAAPSVEAHVQSKGTSSDKVKKTALTELPLHKLSPQHQARVQSLLSEVGYFRRLPTTVIAAEADVYAFFIRYPDVAVSIWRVMGISEMKMWQTGPNEYEGDSGDGSTGTIDVLFRSPELNLLLCEGQYQSPIMKKPIKARSLILLKSTFNREADGTMYVTHRADMYVTFPSQTIETAAKVLSPVTGPMADRTFTEMSLFLRMMSLAMTRRPAWVDQIAGQMEGVAEVRKQQLRQVMVTVHNNERKRQGLPIMGQSMAPPATLPIGVINGAVSSTGPVQGPQPLPGMTANPRTVQAKPVSSSSDASSRIFEQTATEENNTEESYDSTEIINSAEKPTDSKYRTEPGYQVIPKRNKAQSQ